MKKIYYTLAKDLWKKDHKGLPRDLKKGEALLLMPLPAQKKADDTHIACVIEGDPIPFELPATAIAIHYKGKNFGVFMTEDTKEYCLLYCSPSPMNRWQLFSRLQSNIRREDASISPPAYQKENSLLKVWIREKEILYEIAQLEDIAPLF